MDRARAWTRGLAALTVGATAAALVCGFGMWRAGGADGDVAPPGPEATEENATVVAAATVVGTLQDERRGAVEQLGGDPTVPLPSGDAENPLREATDRAVTSLQRWAIDRGGTMLRAFDTAFGALDRLPVLRTGIDDGARADGDRVRATYAEYGATIAAVNDALIAAVETLDRPDGTDGLLLRATVLAQTVTAGDLAWALDHAAGSGGLDGPAETAWVESLLTDLEGQAAAMEEIATPADRDVVDRSLPRELHAQLVEAANAALAGEPGPTVPRPDDSGDAPTSADLVDALSAEAQRQVDEEASGEGDRRAAWMWGLLASGIVAGTGLCALVAVARTRRARAEPQHDLTAILAIPARRDRPTPPGDG